jgi:hypothetical protein
VTAPGSLPRAKLIKLMRAFGYEGPFSGGPHQHMVRGRHTVPIPNKHKNDPSWNLVCIVLEQAGIDEHDALQQLGC